MHCKYYGLIAAALALSPLTQAKDITIFDEVTQGKKNNKGWWGGSALQNDVNVDTRGIKEDNETEPGTAIGQEWDLEAFHLNGTTLSMIGGFNFLTGEGTYASGDIFIDVDGDAVFGPSTPGGTGTTLKSNSLFGYDYVISLQGRGLNGSYDSVDQTIDGTYKVYKISNSSVDVTVAAIGSANPWTYHSGGELIRNPATPGSDIYGTATQTAYTGGEYQGFNGNNNHYELGGFDLSFLGSQLGPGTLFKFTMECGNDNLIGRVPDGGTTMLMLGMSLGGLAFVSRRFRA
ncbi:MAG: VPDSG-CTERM sorting domain-containing protein [Verrucomicrobia bacterium]|nr:VPDSG-CTERM sorting domain-containing protein [Verrucomicrobiota bacterium]